MEQMAPPPGLLNWLQALTWFMVFILSLAGTVKLLRGKPAEPPNQQLEQAHNGLKDDFGRHVEWDREEHQELRATASGIESRLDERMNKRLDKIETDSLNSRRVMHRDIDEISKSVASLTTASELMNQRLVQIDGKLDRTIERHNNHEA